MSNMIDSPPHYTSAAGKIEPIDFCRMFPFTFGNFCKYVLRAGRKGNEAQDLLKAAKYLEWAKEDLWRFRGDLEAYAHLAKCFNNRWLDMVFKTTNYAANFELTVICLRMYAFSLDGAYES